MPETHFIDAESASLEALVGAGANRAQDIVLPSAIDSELLSQICNIISKQRPVQRTIRTDDGESCVVSILPYHSTDSRVKGVVIKVTSLEPFVPEERGERASLRNRQAEGDADGSANLAKLTEREHQIMDLILAGRPNKIIAADLGISQRTVENHRANIMRKTGAKSLPALFRIVYSVS